MWTGSEKKSAGEINRLVNEVINAPDFKPSDLKGFEAGRETAKLDVFAQKNFKDGWHESDVTIEVPDGKKHGSPNDPPIPTFNVPGLLHRPLVEVIKTAWSSATTNSSRFHYFPFRQFWRRSDDKVERIHGELYSSDAFLSAHEELQQAKASDMTGCTLEWVTCGLMLWSDSTHLASFGDAALWPIYMFFGNQSKYDRVRPTSGACHHVAYIPKLPDTFYDFFTQLTGGRGPSADIITHCHRELMHSVWRLLLDNDFVHAYTHGIVMTCPDGVIRRVFPRIFTYSADYPEKVLLATLRNLGRCICPRCKQTKDRVPEMGTKNDDNRRETLAREDDEAYRRKSTTARKAVYNSGLGVKSSAVETLLAQESLVPTLNAFSEFAQKILPFAFNFFSMLVVDFMHEFELGVWKAIFIHLIRMLVSVGEGVVQEFNLRYRQIPTFGRSTIRRISSNTSALKKLAARDYEDYLQ
ncbi:hypothetical protein EUX98_g7748, partial [Antrodiella citrinella]